MTSVQPSRVLITGISGFVGSHLARHLSEKGWKVFGYDQAVVNVKDTFAGELNDRTALKNTLVQSQPDVIFHLAGLIKSDQAEAFYETNVFGTITVFESLLETGQQPLVIIPGSSAVYGPGTGSKPISETFKVRPLTHYALSKLAQETTALRYLYAFQIPVMILRMFNLLGPGQSSALACSAFARQIAIGELRGENEIITGDLSHRRDFIDVRDAACAFALVAEKGKSGQVYNVCSGQAVRMSECLDEMLSMSPRQFQVRLDAEKVQKNDIPSQTGSARKLHEATGWRPQISLQQSLADLLAYWRQRVQSGLE